MLFLIGNSTNNYSLCYPVYIFHNRESLQFPWSLLLILETFLHLLSIFYVAKCIIITVTVRSFHKNMTILVVMFSSQWFEVVVANAISMPYETGYWTLKGMDPTLRDSAIKQWWTDDPEEMVHISDYSPDIWFFVAGFIKVHYFASMATVLLIVSMERSFACWFLSDYEKKSRVWISGFIIVTSQLFNLIMSYMLYFRYFHFFWMLLITALPNVIGLTLILLSRHYNLRITKLFENFDKPPSYTLAARYQAKENIKCFEMIWKVILAGMIFVSISFCVAIIIFLDVFPLLDPILNMIIHVSMSLGPLAVCPTMIYSVESWRNFQIFKDCKLCAKLRGWRLKGKRGNVAIISPMWIGNVKKNELLKKESDTYFNQLSAAWT